MTILSVGCKRCLAGWRLAWIVAVVPLAWCGCGGDPQPITSKTSKYQVADENSAGNAPATSSVSETESPTGRTPSASGSPAAAGQGRPATGIAQTPGSRSADPADADGPPPKPSAQPPASSEPPPTAADGPARLLAHIEKLQSQDPRAATREESLGNLVKIQREIAAIADQLIASGADEATALRAAEAKIRALTLLSQIQQDAGKEIGAFISDLKKSPHPKLLRFGQRIEFAQLMDHFATGDVKDSAKVMAEFKRIFEEEEKNAELFSLSQQVTQVFVATRHSPEATEVMKLIGDAFEGNSNAELANAAKMVREQIPILELDLSGKFSAIREGKPKADEEFLAALDKLFIGREPGAVTLQFLAQMVQMIEIQDLALADKVYTKMTAAYAKSSPELAKAVDGMATNFGKRNAIVGKPFTVEGTTLDGQPFDWNKYKGKVVLVDFWATWCGPCLEEIPNIKQNYDQYHDQGFEVVGVNLDEKPADVQLFFSRQRLPWPTVLSPDPQKVGFDHPLAVKCGVEAIPFLVLIDRDGTALALNLRGEELGKKLATMFTPSGAPPANPAKAAVPEKKAGG